MDIETARAELLTLANEILSMNTNFADAEDPNRAAFVFALKAQTLAAQAQNVDDWLARGGFLPQAWQR